MGTASAEPLGPIREDKRIITLDALRGFALLGIFMVNIQVFAYPLTYFLDPLDLQSGTAWDYAAWWFVKAFFEYKFISLFSLLFGAGLIVHMTRAEAKGRPFVGMYLRRTFLLAIIGLTHGFLLWYGDILFIYSIIGTIMLLFRKLSPKVMLIIAGGIVGFFMLLGVLFIVLAFTVNFDFGGPPPSPVASDDAALVAEPPETVDELDNAAPSDEMTSPDDGEAEADAPEPTFAEDHPELVRWMPWLPDLIELQFNPTSEGWAEAEIAAYRDGPFLMAEGYRAFSFVAGVTMAVFSYGWKVIAMFLIGAALMKLGFFTTAPAQWRRRVFAWGMLLGLPLEIAHATLHLLAVRTDDLQLRQGLGAISGTIHEISSLLLCLGIVGGFALLVDSGRARGLLNALANVGRLALSNYLLQTVIATAIFYWWGFAQFGEVRRAPQLIFVVVIYLGQVVLSALWLRIFTIGPVEWLWRSLTYMRLQPMMREKPPS